MSVNLFFYLTYSIRDFYHVKSRDLFVEYCLIRPLGNFIFNWVSLFVV